VERSYNSRDPRRSAAFGAGWSTVFDGTATEQYAPSGAVETVLVTYPTGQQVAFGRNGDGSFSPPQGRFATFAAVTGGGYSLTDKNATVYKYTQPTGAAGSYAISSIADAAGRTETFTYTAGKLTKATSASGRTLSLTWATPTGASAAHVSTVVTDAVVAGNAGTALTWSYTYSGDQLSKVCPPTSSTACTTYTYPGGVATFDDGAGCRPTLVLAPQRGLGHHGDEFGAGQRRHRQRHLLQRDPGPAGGTARVDGDVGVVQRHLVQDQDPDRPGRQLDLPVDRHVVQDLHRQRGVVQLPDRRRHQRHNRQ
jgi:hypothetical protein